MLETIVVATTKVTTVVGDGNLWCVVTVQEGSINVNVASMDCCCGGHW